MFFLSQAVFMFVVITMEYTTTNAGTTKYHKKTSGRKSESINEIYSIDKEMKNKNSLESDLRDIHVTEIREKRESHLEDPCYQSGLCAMNNDSPAACYCDDLCVHFGDCCYDVVLDTVDNGTISNLPDISLFKCVRNKHVHSILIGYWMIAECPNGYDNKLVASNCHSSANALENLPAFGQNRIVYANAHCAICNNVTDYQLATIHYDLGMCPIPTNYSASFLAKLLCAKYKYLPPPDYQFRNCYMTMPTVNESIQCRLRQNPLFHYSSGLLKNYYCGDASVVEGYHDCFDGLKMQLYGPDPVINIFFPFTVLVTFKLPITREARTCNDDTILDSEMEICLETVCYDDWKLSNGICESDPILQNYPLILKKSLKINQVLDRKYLRRLSILLAFSFITNSFRIYATDIYFFTFQNANNENTETKGLLEIIIRISNWLKMEEIEDLEKMMEKMSITYEEKDNYTGLLKTTNIETFNINDSNTEMFENLHSEKFVTINYYKQYGHYIKTVPYFNVYDGGFCLDVSISAWLVNDSSIIHDKNMSSLAIFEIEDQILVVDAWSCEKSSPVLQTTRQNSIRTINFQTILTYVCMGLSCIALILAMVTYRHLSFTDDIPGSNTLNALVSLLLAHVFFLVGINTNDNQIICTCVGVLIHYFWLSHFAFMTITTVYMSLTFTRLSEGLSEATLKWKLTVLGYSVSLLFVASSLVIEYVNHIPLGMGYNGTTCFPIEYPANSISVSLPIVTSIFINALCLTLGVCSICRQTANQNLVDTKQLSYFLVYIRLVIFSGSIWIFGILSALFPTPVLQTIFIVLLGLQGFFVSISSTCTMRVYRSLSSSSSIDKPNKNKKMVSSGPVIDMTSHQPASDLS